MDFLKKFATETTDTKPNTNTDTEKKGSGDQPEASQAELLANAKVVADAARATLQKEENKVDKSKVAGAAADLLDAAERYGKLDPNTGVGSYVEKAEKYLHNYESSNSTTPENKTTTPPADVKPAGGEPATTAPATKSEPPTKPEGGIGSYAKMAEGFFNK